MKELPKVKMFVEPVGLHSRAMTRVANAIKQHAPAYIVFVDRAEDADVQVLHVIDWHDEFHQWPRPYIAIQYCLETTSNESVVDWSWFWAQSSLVWSYYDLAKYMERGVVIPCREKLFHAPLGVDDIFRHNAHDLLRTSVIGAKPFALESRRLIVTTGYVSGSGAEAIEEVWNAAERTGWAGVHIGPPAVQGMRRKTMPAGWYSAEGCTDAELAAYYRRAYYVAGLRYIEGFEMPVVEGLLCGATPLVFNQSSQKHWFGDIAHVISEGSSRAVTSQLEELFSVAEYKSKKNRVTVDCVLSGPEEIATALARFNWASIIPDMFEAAGL